MERTTTRIGSRPAVRNTLIGVAVAFTLLFILAPLFVIVAQAFSAGLRTYIGNILTPDTLHAIQLTVITALVAVPVNTLFGIAAASAVTKFRFPGRKLLIAVIGLPLSVSPIVVGAAYLFVSGA